MTEKQIRNIKAGRAVILHDEQPHALAKFRGVLLSREFPKNRVQVFRVSDIHSCVSINDDGWREPEVYLNGRRVN